MEASHFDAERIAVVFHDRYEWWAIQHGWSSQVGATTAWADVPEANRKTMISTVTSMLETDVILPGPGLADG